MYNYLFITRVPEVARAVEEAGVSRIFVDLEINGKEQRQGHLNTVISRHCMEDVARVKAVLKRAELLVRLNPLYEQSQSEVDQAIDAGADIIMQPMFSTISEVEAFGQMIAGRARFMPLVETESSVRRLAQITALDCVDEIHIGLNDLHLDMGLKFMFEPLASGLIERLLIHVHKPYGIGGIARIGQGAVAGELVMAEHIRLGSSGTILSRAFHGGAESIDELNYNFSFKHEFQLLNSERQRLLSLDSASLALKHQEFRNAVERVVQKL
jgi:hypothetical protein